MDSRVYAHTPGPLGVWHALSDHLNDTAKLAEEFAIPLGLPLNARFAALLHDVGKYSPDFQRYLEQAHSATLHGTFPPQRGSVTHTAAGLVLAREMGSDIVAMIIGGHHIGLPSATELKNKYNTLNDITRARINLDEAKRDGLGLPSVESLQAEFSRPRFNRYDFELLIRLLFSALVDADWLDTESHFTPAKRSNQASWPETQQLLNSYLDYMTQLQHNVTFPLTTVNQVRQEVLANCLSAAEQSPGVFKLTVPTGGGKTLATLGFALKHAIAHSLKRIIVVIPFLSIIDQTADVFRKVFASIDGICPVVECHSAAYMNLDDQENLGQLQLAAENWDAPVIITTQVQLFDSLLSNRPSTCRKLHRLAQSIVVLDEAQTMPLEMLEPCISVLNTLVEHAGTSLVLSTATQPALSGKSLCLRGFSRQPVEITFEPERHFKALRRVAYEVVPEFWSWKRVAQEVQRHDCCLAVLNTRADALALLGALNSDDAVDGVFHLSSNLCGAHRRVVLAEVRRRLTAGESCRLVSTQVVEAGVDLDFPVVLRAMAPLDSIIQAAGRCNREGLMEHDGHVVVFTAEEEHYPQGCYRTRTDEAKKKLYQGCDLHNPETFTEYFELVLEDCPLDRKELQHARKALDYPEVAKLGHVINVETEPVIVGWVCAGTHPMLSWQAECATLLHTIRSKAESGISISREDWRKLQPYFVNLQRYETEKAECMLDRTSVPGLTLWTGEYDALRGLLIGQTTNPADLVV